MYTEKDVYEKIKKVFPEIGELGKDITIKFNDIESVWVVDVYKDSKHMRTYLEEEVADVCIEKGKCLDFGVQIEQLKNKILNM